MSHKSLETARNLLIHKRFPEAIEWYKKVLGEDSWNYHALCELGNAFYLNGQPKNAVGLFYMSTHAMITLKLLREGYSRAPKTEPERKLLSLICEGTVIHLGMTMITVHKQYFDIMKSFSSDPTVELKHYSEGLLGKGPGLGNEVFLKKIYNIGGNFLYQGLIWDLIGVTDEQATKTLMSSYNRLGFLDSSQVA